jgi:SWI/SNF-related matrix-associated actin-dependent regulator 1 of chromatin subfamily A
VALYYKDEWPCLIIVPSSLRLQWADQFEKWVPQLKGGDVNVIMSGKGECNKLVNIISYDLVPKKIEEITAKRFKVIIADESHLLKGWDTKRTQKIVPCLIAAKRAILLSGTPVLSRPKELYTQLKAIDSNLFPKFPEYGIRYGLTDTEANLL